MSEVIFMSGHKNLKLNSVLKGLRFQNTGTMGLYKTSDEGLINKLRSHNQYGKLFYERIPQDSKTVHNGVRSAGSHPEAGESEKVEALKKEFYDLLKSRIIKSDGSFRQDASDIEISKFNQLKMDLNIQ